MGWFYGFKLHLVISDRGELLGCYLTPGNVDDRRPVPRMAKRLLLRKRALIETVNDQLKNISQIEYARHRSLWNFLGNVAAGLIAYTWREKKPSLNIRVKEQFLISN